MRRSPPYPFNPWDGPPGRSGIPSGERHPAAIPPSRTEGNLGGLLVLSALFPPMAVYLTWLSVTGPFYISRNGVPVRPVQAVPRSRVVTSNILAWGLALLTSSCLIGGLVAEWSK